MGNKEFGPNKYQAGRFEATQRTGHAFLGEKEKHDLRSQFLSNPSAKVEAFNPLDQKFIAKLAGENPQQQENLTGFVNNFQTLRSQDELLMWEAVDHVKVLQSQRARKKILSQIRTRAEQAKAKKVEATEPVLQTENALKDSISTIWKLQGERFRANLKSILNLPFFIINNLPDRVYKALPITTILALILSACASVAVVPQPEIPNQNDPTPGETTGLPEEEKTAIASAIIEPTSTATPVPTETQVVDQVEQLLTAHLAGESIDVSSLSPTEFREFSTQLAEQRNEERGVNPIIYNNEAYISPDNYMMMNYDGHPDMNETITMFRAIEGFDAEGNLQILNHNGEIVTIENSADVDWNMRVTDPFDPRIDWPNLPNNAPDGSSPIEYLLSGKLKIGWTFFITPSILLDKTMGQIFMPGEGKGFVSLFRFLTVADTDANGTPILFRLSLMIPNATQLFEEGSDFRTGSIGLRLFEHEDFFKNLQENSIYYMGICYQQNEIWELNYQTSMDAYQGLITGNEIPSILTHQGGNTQDMMLLPPTLLIQKNKD